MSRQNSIERPQHLQSLLTGRAHLNSRIKRAFRSTCPLEIAPGVQQGLEETKAVWQTRNAKRDATNSIMHYITNPRICQSRPLAERLKVTGACPAC